MSSLLKGHTHLQREFWVFFDELRPPSARPGQFEEACWPEEAGGGIDGGEGVGLGSGGGASGGFDEVTLPDLEEEDIPPMKVAVGGGRWDLMASTRSVIGQKRTASASVMVPAMMPSFADTRGKDALAATATRLPMASPGR